MRCLQKANLLERKIGEDPLCLILWDIFCGFARLQGMHGVCEGGKYKRVAWGVGSLSYCARYAIN